MTTIPGSAQSALSNLAYYPHLNAIIDPKKFLANASMKYPNGPEIVGNEVHDLITALLVHHYPLFRQDSNNAATPEGVLSSIDDILANSNFTQTQKNQLETKLLNFRTTQLWDTLTELLLYKHYSKLLPSNQLQIEYPLGQALRKGFQPKDADVAILDPLGQPKLLIDAITPNQRQSHQPQFSFEDCIEEKYNKKFLQYCASKPSTEVAITLSIIKSEDLILLFPLAMFGIVPVQPLQSQKLDTIPHLKEAHVVTFRCSDKRLLELHELGRYSK